ncbi:MAG: hypothetical protein MI924_29350, partial [Chloroflexales bacterium]|nr:hypothetical protein [Chloroflexales bacterium]
DFKAYRSEMLADGVSTFDLSRDNSKLIYFSRRRLRVIAAGEKAPGSSGGSRRSGWINLSRVRISVKPPSEWEQMLREAWRLQRDHFWTEHMSRIDWQAVCTAGLKLASYAPICRSRRAPGCFSGPVFSFSSRTTGSLTQSGSRTFTAELLSVWLHGARRR